jgi:pSer/pThr/pTyr-binding forkhead associated (FHA) protein
VPAYTKPFLSYKGKKYKLKDTHVVVGRSSACTIVVGDDKKVSREHCKIESRGPNKWIVSDMGSNSGTRLNGNKITQFVLKVSCSVVVFLFVCSIVSFSRAT